MQRYWVVCVLLLLCPLVLVAQTERCNTAKASPRNGAAGVITQEVELNGEWGTTRATVLFPIRDVASGGVVFSHSTIKSIRTVKDLLPLALTLSRAGAAVIIPDRELTWPPKDRSMNRESGVVLCAARWLASNAKIERTEHATLDANQVVIRNAFGYVGPRICDPTVTKECRYEIPEEPLFRNFVWVPIGETEGGDSTEAILADGSGAAKYLQRKLGLRPIDAVASISSETR